MLEKKIHKVVHKRLKNDGYADFAKNTVEINNQLKGYSYLLTMLHEHFHLKHPDWSETKIRKQSSLTARFLWQNGFRWVDVKK